MRCRPSRCFPSSISKLRADPTLVRAAFDESLRWDSPSRMAGRITTREVEIGGYTVPAGQRVGLMFAAANRDPRAWPESRPASTSAATCASRSAGATACTPASGRVLAQLEAHALLAELARRVARIELAGEPEPWMTTIGHGPAKLPVRLYGTEVTRHARRIPSGGPRRRLQGLPNRRTM